MNRTITDERDISLSVKEIRERIDRYGFTEISDIIIFLDVICHGLPDLPDYIYIRRKLDRCLSHHDNGSDYFIPLREFACELDAILYNMN